MKMTPMQARARLEAAAELITSVVSNLDPKSRRCQCCGLIVHGDMTAFRALTMLEQLPDKLKRLANTPSLTTKESHND